MPNIDKIQVNSGEKVYKIMDILLKENTKQRGAVGPALSLFILLWPLYGGLSDFQFKKSLSFLEREGWRSFLKAFASIWRIRSRVTLNSLPTSSKVLGLPSSIP